VLVLPACNCEAMQLHLDEIATKVAPGLRKCCQLYAGETARARI
jgi:hypothetical protein